MQSGIFDNDGHFITGAIIKNYASTTSITIFKERKTIEIKEGIFENDELVTGKIVFPNFEDSEYTKVLTIEDGQPSMIETGIFKVDRLITGTTKFPNYKDSKLTYSVKIINSIEKVKQIGTFNENGYLKDGIAKFLNYNNSGQPKIMIIKDSKTYKIKIGLFNIKDKIITGTIEISKFFRGKGLSKINIFKNGNLIKTQRVYRQSDLNKTADLPI